MGLLENAHWHKCDGSCMESWDCTKPECLGEIIQTCVDCAKPKAVLIDPAEYADLWSRGYRNLCSSVSTGAQHLSEILRTFADVLDPEEEQRF